MQTPVSTWLENTWFARAVMYQVNTEDSRHENLMEIIRLEEKRA